MAADYAAAAAVQTWGLFDGTQGPPRRRRRLGGNSGPAGTSSRRKSAAVETVAASVNFAAAAEGTEAVAGTS